MIQNYIYIFVIMFIGVRGFASDLDSVELVIKNHKYTPELIHVKANQRFKVRITNDDITAEEFESKSMIIEKFIGPKRTITVVLGPLKPGVYDFFGCLHPQTAKGQIVVK